MLTEPGEKWLFPFREGCNGAAKKETREPESLAAEVRSQGSSLPPLCGPRPPQVPPSWGQQPSTMLPRPLPTQESTPRPCGPFQLPLPTEAAATQPCGATDPPRQLQPPTFLPPKEAKDGVTRSPAPPGAAVRQRRGWARSRGLCKHHWHRFSVGGGLPRARTASHPGPGRWEGKRGRPAEPRPQYIPLEQGTRGIYVGIQLKARSCWEPCRSGRLSGRVAPGQAWKLGEAGTGLPLPCGPLGARGL